MVHVGRLYSNAPSVCVLQGVANKAPASRAVSLAVLPKLDVATPVNLLAGSVGAAYGQPVEATGGEPPYQFQLAGGGVVPPGSRS